MRRPGISLALGAFAASCVATACYTTGDGTAPPPNQLYFPVGLAVSSGGNILYAINSDFDLQWNGGTIQSYNLRRIRRHAALTIQDPNNPELAKVRPPPPTGGSYNCDSSSGPPEYTADGTQRQPLGETCAPPVNSTIYVKDSATIGALATDLQLAKVTATCLPTPHGFPGCDKTCPSHQHCELVGGDRLFAPLRGTASVLWADVSADRRDDVAPNFSINCGARTNNRCDSVHSAGDDPSTTSRQITMPGEPFGMAQSDDGTAIAVTHQNDTKVSLLTTGLAADRPHAPGQTPPPALQFVLDGVAAGGNGIVAVPHDPDAFVTGQTRPSPAFLETSRASTDVSLLRYYADEGFVPTTQGYHGPRPFLVKENVFTLTANAGGGDSRGILVDPTPRILCKANVKPAGPGRSDADVAADMVACARTPARVFFANRSPATVIVAEIGETSTGGDGTYDPDALRIFGNIPVSIGTSRVYLAPIVDASGSYALRLFVVCFDSASVYVFDPSTLRVENVIRTGPGPFAVAFDPFDLEDAALRKKVPTDSLTPTPDDPGGGPPVDVKRYRFAYIASFTQSYIQVLDLDNSQPNKNTFEKIVFRLGQPTPPKGTQ